MDSYSCKRKKERKKKEEETKRYGLVVGDKTRCNVNLESCMLVDLKKTHRTFCKLILFNKLTTFVLRKNLYLFIY